MTRWPHIGNTEPPDWVVSEIWDRLPSRERRQHRERWQECLESLNIAQGRAFISRYKERRPKLRYPGKPEYWQVLRNKSHPEFHCDKSLIENAIRRLSGRLSEITETELEDYDDALVQEAVRKAEAAGDLKFLRELRSAIRAKERAGTGEIEIDRMQRWLIENWIWLRPKNDPELEAIPGLCWFAAVEIQQVYDLKHASKQSPRYRVELAKRWKNAITRLGLVRPKQVLVRRGGVRRRWPPVIMFGEYREYLI